MSAPEIWCLQMRDDSDRRKPQQSRQLTMLRRRAGRGKRGTVALEEGEAAPTWPLSASRSRSPKALVRRWLSALLHQVQLQAPRYWHLDYPTSRRISSFEAASSKIDVPLRLASGCLVDHHLQHEDRADSSAERRSRARPLSLHSSAEVVVCCITLGWSHTKLV